MKGELVALETTDALTLSGIFFEPKKKTDRTAGRYDASHRDLRVTPCDAAIFLHGCGTTASVFSNITRTNILAEELGKQGIAFLAFNNRGSGGIWSLKRPVDENEFERVKAGTAYELIADCVHDIDGAVNFLHERGYKNIHLIGHSTGANKICVYDRLKQKNNIKRYVLLAGGDDSGLYFYETGEKLFWKALKRCKEEIKKGNGEKLVPQYFKAGLMSYQSLYDMANPDGLYNTFPFYEVLFKKKLSKKKKLFSEISKISKPTLAVYGEQDEHCYGRVGDCVEALKENANSKITFKTDIIPETDHGFHDKDQELGKLIADFLSKK